ncbi:type II toxin-antitoxin system RelE/ParE family toxin [Mesoterricola sediminis]|uniref:type II toxin-antitoxin system RelE/ParE family toxin n=1 Tax=Mesoterricola sediminis TaxID=2927980 RepID=UPI003743BD65
MIEVHWSGPAGRALETALDFIAMDNRDAADRLARAVHKAISRLERFPTSGRMVPELDDPNLREVVHPPFRIIYQPGARSVEILAVIRSEQAPDFAAITGRLPRDA